MFDFDELKKCLGKIGDSGKSNMPVKGISIDTRTMLKGEAFIAIKGDNFDGHDFIDEAVRKGACCLVAQKKLPATGVFPVPVIEVDDTKAALSAIAGYWRNKFNIPVIAVTGSCGKTTTKDMIAHVLSSKYKALKNEGTKNNLIGLSLSLLKIRADHTIAVLELGSNHFGEISQLAKICRPNTCVITNIGSSHLKFFKDLNGVFREKTSLLENLISPKIAFLNGDCSFLRNLLSGCFKSAPFFTFGTGKDNDFRAHRVKMERNKLMFYSPLNKSTFCLNTFGSHNVYNAMAAIAVCRIFGIGYDEIRKGLSSFEFPRGRLKFVDLGKDINIVDDTYNSNPSSLQAALTALEAYRNKGRKIFVMGDMLELGESEKFFHTQAANAAARFCDTLITVGNLSSSAARKIAATSGEIKIFTCLSSAEASDVLFDKVSPGKDDIVLVKGSRAMKMDQIFNGIKV